MDWKILLGLMLVLIVVGCVNNTESPLKNLLAVPSSYCATYSTQLSSARGNTNTTIEFCKDSKNRAVYAKAMDMAVLSFCLEGKGYTCFQGSCSEDTSNCDSSEDAMDKVNTNKYEEKFYEHIADRNIGGVMAKCYRVDTIKAAKTSGADISNILEQNKFMQFCYHPIYKYVLYYSYDGITTEVQNFVTPAPTSKFVLPSSSQM